MLSFVLFSHSTLLLSSRLLILISLSYSHPTFLLSSRLPILIPPSYSRPDLLIPSHHPFLIRNHLFSLRHSILIPPPTLIPSSHLILPIASISLRLLKLPYIHLAIRFNPLFHSSHLPTTPIRLPHLALPFRPVLIWSSYSPYDLLIPFHYLIPIPPSYYHPFSQSMITQRVKQTRGETHCSNCGQSF